MNIKKFFCLGNNSQKDDVELGTYSDLLGLNRDFKFALSKSKVADQTEFDSLVSEAEATLESDLKRFGETFYKIPTELRKKLTGIGSMTIIADDEGEISIKFHKRDADGLWDGISKKYPEKNTEGKYKHEIFFDLDEDEEDE